MAIFWHFSLSSSSTLCVDTGIRTELSEVQICIVEGTPATYDYPRWLGRAPLCWIAFRRAPYGHGSTRGGSSLALSLGLSLGMYLSLSLGLGLSLGTLVRLIGL